METGKWLGERNCYTKRFDMNKYENIPVELQELPQWVCANDGSKVPMKAFENAAASSTNSETWADFETALSMVKDGYYDYCGFVFADNGYVGIDIDEGYDDDGFFPILVRILSESVNLTRRNPGVGEVFIPTPWNSPL